MPTQTTLFDSEKLEKAEEKIKKAIKMLDSLAGDSRDYDMKFRHRVCKVLEVLEGD